MLAGDRCALEQRQGWQNDLLRALRRDGHRVMRCTPLFPRGSWPSKRPRRQDVMMKAIQRKQQSVELLSTRSLRPGSATLTLASAEYKSDTPGTWGWNTLGLLRPAAPDRLNLLRGRAVHMCSHKRNHIPRAPVHLTSHSQINMTFYSLELNVVSNQTSQRDLV